MSKQVKNRRTPKKKNNILRNILYSLLLLFFIGVIAGCIAGAVFFAYIAQNAPKFESKQLYSIEPSNIYDNKGNLITSIGTEDRVILTYDQIPEVLINAIIATEDSRFFQHRGIDLPRFIVASAYQVLGKNVGGASTLTMQLSKNTYTSKNASGWEGIKRKFTDVYLAVFKIEPTYSKEEILEFYVNSQFLGSGYGVEVTSKNYFGKSAKDLNLAEAAMIAGLFQAPGKYNPYTNPEGTEERRQDVLRLMKRHGYITEEEYNIAKVMTVEKIVQPKQYKDIGSGLVDPTYQYFVDMAIEEVRRETGYDPYTTSMDIYTTMDSTHQKTVSDIMNGKTFKWQKKKVQAGIAVVDVHTGAITAVGGGRNVSTANSLNRATDIKRQIGSTAKPLYDYAPAIEYLNWNTGTMISDEAYTYSNGKKINNWDGKYIGYNTITTHLKMSRNIPALKTFQAVKNEDIVKFVKNLGLHPEVYNGKIHEAHAIGGYNGENPLSMANAYAAFANGGYYNEPYSVAKVIYNDTGEVYVTKNETKQVMSDSTAYLITKMLQETASYGIDAGSYKGINGLKYAAKTGTTNFDEATIKKYKLKGTPINEYWIVGYNNQYSIGIWYGYDKITDGYLTLGGSQHQKLLQAVGKKVFKAGTDKWTQPKSVSKGTVETGSATPILPSEYTPSSYKTTAYFVSGTEPNKVSEVFSKLPSVSGLTSVNNGDGSATISWNAISTPKALDKSYISSLNASAFKDKAGADKFANSQISKNKKFLGSLGYNVYIEKNGTTELKGFTTEPYFTLQEENGSYRVTIKSTYKNYATLMSPGVNTMVTITGYTAPTPTPEENITQP